MPHISIPDIFSSSVQLGYFNLEYKEISSTDLIRHIKDYSNLTLVVEDQEKSFGSFFDGPRVMNLSTFCALNFPRFYSAFLYTFFLKYFPTFCEVFYRYKIIGIVHNTKSFGRFYWNGKRYESKEDCLQKLPAGERGELIWMLDED